MKLSIKGILIGGITDIVLSSLLGVVLAIFVTAMPEVSAAPKEQMGKAALAAIHAHPLLHALQLAIGFLCSVAGGYVAAKLAKQSELPNAALASWLCVGLGIYSLATRQGDETTAIHLVLIALTPCAYVAGGYLRVKTSGHRAVSPA